MLDDKLLVEFMLRFYGYGTFSAPIWFVGMEEGTGNSLDELGRRLTTWDQRGRHVLEDVAGYHEAMGITRPWHEPVVLQKTWGRLIRVLLSSQGLSPTKQQVKAFQRDTWGRRNTDTCSLELLPLPSPSLSQWLYSSFSTLPYLTSRRTYEQHISPTRLQHLQALIAQHQPTAVVFYGKTYLKYWQAIAGGVMQRDEVADFSIGRQDNTTYIAMQHPNTRVRGITNAYFDSVGQRLSAPQ